VQEAPNAPSILFLHKNNYGYRVKNRQIKNDKHFSNYSLGGGRQKHQKPAFTGRRREARSICHPPPLSQGTPIFVMFHGAVATWQVTFKSIYTLPRTG